MGLPSNNPWAAYMPPEPQQFESTHHDSQLHNGIPASSSQGDAPPSYSEVLAEGSSKTPPSIPREKDRVDSEPYQTTFERDLQSTLTSASSDSDDAVLQQALEFTHHAPQSHQTYRRLQRPVVVPQVTAGVGQPFARGYSHDLQTHDVNMKDFIEFIDNLNIVSAGSPPLQVLDLAGGAVGMVPHHYANAIGAGIQAVAKIGKVAVSKTRGTLFLKKANEDFFYPRGLQVELVTGEVLRVKLEIPREAPLTGAFDFSEGLSIQERRLAAIQEVVAPITFDVPPPEEQTNILNRMCAAQQTRIAAKSEKSALKDREKYAEKQVDLQSKLNKYSRKQAEGTEKLDRKQGRQVEKRDERIAKIELKFQKDMRKKPEDAHKAGKEREKEIKKVVHEFEDEMKKIDKDFKKSSGERDKDARKETKDAQKEDKELKSSEKILWMLVSNRPMTPTASSQ